MRSRPARSARSRGRAIRASCNLRSSTRFEKKSMRRLPEMIRIGEGMVRLGMPPFPSDSSFPHPWKEREVFVPEFSAARYAVTVGEYLDFADVTGYALCDALRTDPRFADRRAPAAFVSWIDAVRYAQWLARETGRPYRLLRDAEYERAARGGLEGAKFPWGDESPQGRADFRNPQGSP